MNLLNEQAQLFVVAAACLLIGVACLYFALGLYGMLLDRALRLLGVHAAIVSYICSKGNRVKWWVRTGTWFERNIRSRD